MGKILLIKASKQPERCTFPHIVSHPLGIMYFASALRNEGHQVKIVDMWLDYKPPAPEVIGFERLICVT